MLSKNTLGIKSKAKLEIPVMFSYLRLNILYQVDQSLLRFNSHITYVRMWLFIFITMCKQQAYSEQLNLPTTKGIYVRKIKD